MRHEHWIYIEKERERERMSGRDDEISRTGYVGKREKE